MISPSALKSLVPINSLLPSDRAALARNAKLGSYQPGQVLFNRGDASTTTIYLLRGEIELSDGQRMLRVKSDSKEALHPIAQGAVRSNTAVCIKDAEVLFLDREYMDLLLTWSQTSGVEVVDMSEQNAKSGDWMTALLQHPAFHNVPAGNVAKIFAAVEPVSLAAGETIIRQGDPGDFYYLITEGECQVLMRDASGKDREVNRISVSQSFGEEALVSGNPRSATVKALTDCKLMRLSASEFETLLRDPLLKEIEVEEVPPSAVLIDVRLPSEYQRGRLPGSVNMPLHRLRKLSEALAPDRVYVVYCDTGRRSASATYLLCERGFNACHLKGGVPTEDMPIRG